MIINLIGPMAVGKSYFSRRFIERHPEFILASIDDCRIEALKRIGSSDEVDPMEIEETAWDILLQQCLDNEHVILETSGLSWRLKQVIWHEDIMIRGIYTVKMMGNIDKCLKRLREREPQEVPFPYSFADEEESCKWLHENMYRAPHNLLIDVDTGEDYGILLQKAEKYILAAKLKYDADLLRYGKNELKIKRGREMAETKVTSVSFTPNKSKSKVKAFANVTLNGEVTIKGYKIAEGSHGLFVGAPSQFSEKDKKWYDNVHYTSVECRDIIHDQILQSYRQRQDAAQTDSDMNQVDSDEIPF